MIIGYLMIILIFSLTPTQVTIYFMGLLGIKIDPIWFSNAMLMESINSDVKPPGSKVKPDI